MIIETFCSGPLNTNCYTLCDAKSGRFVLIDAPFGSTERVFRFAQERSLKLAAIWLTHSHWDHIAEIAPLYRRFSERDLAEKALPIAIHELDAENLLAPGSDGLACSIPLTKVEPTTLLVGGDTLKFATLFFEVLHTPGHSPGSICLYSEKEALLFSGDTLFRGAMGSIALPTAQPSAMRSSLSKLALLPKCTRILPGHGPSTILEEEIEWLRRRVASADCFRCFPSNPPSRLGS